MCSLIFLSLPSDYVMPLTPGLDLRLKILSQLTVGRLECRVCGGEKICLARLPRFDHWGQPLFENPDLEADSS